MLRKGSTQEMLTDISYDMEEHSPGAGGRCPSGLSCAAEHSLSVRFLVPVVPVPYPVHDLPLTHESSSNTQPELRLFPSQDQDHHQIHLSLGSVNEGAATHITHT